MLPPGSLFGKVQGFTSDSRTTDIPKSTVTHETPSTSISRASFDSLGWVGGTSIMRLAAVTKTKSLPKAWLCLYKCSFVGSNRTDFAL